MRMTAAGNLREQIQEFFVDATLGSDTGTGNIDEPFQTVAKVNTLQLGAGSVVRFKRGELWSEDLLNLDSGGVGAPVTFSAYGVGNAPIIRQAHIEGDQKVFEDININGEKRAGEVGLDVRNGTNIIIRRSEVFDLKDNGVQLINLNGVHLEDLHIHHCLRDSYTGVGSTNPDAHGISLEGVVGLTAAGTLEIHHVSGDSVQADPARGGTDDIDFSGAVCIWWTGPLATDFDAGWVTGNVPGENAIDTKVLTGTRMALTVGRLTMHGWQGGIENMAALNIKEGCDFVADRLTVFDSFFAFRVRGGVDNPDITIMNALVYDVTTALRIEDGLNDLKVYNCTFGSGITNFVQEAGGGLGLNADLRNNAFLGVVPAIFSDPTNVQAELNDFNDEVTNDYRLLDTATDLVDQGDTIAVVTVDRNGNPRSVPYEVGAFEGALSTSQHAHFDFLVGQPNAKDAYSFRSLADVEDLYFWQGGIGTITDPKYDDTEESYRYDFHGVQSCSGTGNEFTQMHAPVTAESGTYLIFWQTKYDVLWGEYDNHFSSRDAWTGNHKMSQLQGGGQDGTDPDMTISCKYVWAFEVEGLVEPFVCQWPAISGRGGWPSFDDALVANPFEIKAGKWTNRWIFFDPNNGVVDFYAGDEDRAPVKVSGDNEVTFTAGTPGQQQITNFRIGEWNISNSPDNSGTPLMPVWERDVVILRGLTRAEAEAMIAHPTAQQF